MFSYGESEATSLKDSGVAEAELFAAVLSWALANCLSIEPNAMNANDDEWD